MGPSSTLWGSERTEFVAPGVPHSWLLLGATTNIVRDPNLWWAPAPAPREPSEHQNTNVQSPPTGITATHWIMQYYRLLQHKNTISPLPCTISKANYVLYDPNWSRPQHHYTKNKVVYYLHVRFIVRKLQYLAPTTIFHHIAQIFDT